MEREDFNIGVFRYLFLGLQAGGFTPAESSQTCQYRIGSSAEDLAASPGADWVKF